MDNKTPKPITTPILDAVFNDDATRELAERQKEIEAIEGNGHYEMTEDQDVLDVGKAIDNARYLDGTVKPPSSNVKGVVDVSSVTAGKTPEDIATLLDNLRKELKTDIKYLIDERLDRDLKVKEAFPSGAPRSWREEYSEIEKRRHAETKQWLEKFRKSPVASKLTEALIVGDTFKTPWARKIAVKLFELDRTVYKTLNDVANMEFVVTRHNVVSKFARKVLGTKLPDEPEYVETDTGTTTRWADIAKKAAKISYIRDAEPERVSSNSKKHQTETGKIT